MLGSVQDGERQGPRRPSSERRALRLSGTHPPARRTQCRRQRDGARLPARVPPPSRVGGHRQGAGQRRPSDSLSVFPHSRPTGLIPYAAAPRKNDGSCSKLGVISTSKSPRCSSATMKSHIAVAVWPGRDGALEPVVLVSGIGHDAVRPGYTVACANVRSSTPELPFLIVTVTSTSGLGSSSYSGVNRSILVTCTSTPSV